MKTFEELGVCSEVCRAIEELGFVQPMPVQEEVIPRLIESQQDMIALAQTGTGKTAAFGLPLLQRISLPSSPSGKGEAGGLTQAPQALVLSPTRELCLQIADDLREFSKYMEDAPKEIKTRIRELSDETGDPESIRAPGYLQFEPIDVSNAEMLNNRFITET